MERQFHNEDFERLLRNNADQYRMYPSEKVWKGIYASLHSRRRWYGITALAMLLITGSIITIFILNNDSDVSNITETKNTPGSAVRLRLTTPAGSVALKKEGQLKGSPRKTADIALTENNGNNTGSVEMNFYSATDDGEIIAETRNNIPGVIADFSPFKVAVADDSKPEAVISAKELSLLNNRLNPVIPVVEKTTEKETTQGEKTKDKTAELMAIASNNAPVNPKIKSAKVTAQFYFTPTISYRKLSENKSYPSAQPFGITRFTDVNNVVNHKPAMGFEFGIEGHYSLNSRLSVKTGLQFNINRYDIRAYSHPTEIATIALNSGTPRDSVAALSNYRNFSGYSPNWLENFYFQVAMPVGAELIIADNKKIRWGVAGTIQPTYVIGDRAYLISSDYKNYAKVPNLMRRWNLSTGLETFVAYSTGRVGWQVGPQVRYQHLSSFVSRYPVKENLFDVGLKVGARLIKRK
jgi:hypothetical protein